MQEATRNAIKKKFGKKRYIVSKAVPRYPRGAEREYMRVVASYMNILKKSVSEHIPIIREALETGRYRADAATDDGEWTASNAATVTAIERIFNDIMEDVTEKSAIFELQKRIEKLSNMNRKLTITEWKRVVKRTLGIDIMEDYYNGTKFKEMFDKWVKDNVSLISTIPQETLGAMREIVKEGYLGGQTNKTIAKRIQEAYGVNKSRAQFYARDQTAKLNADITREQQNDAGVDEYIWRTAGNISTFPNSGRVRESHAKLNNKRFKYSNPPIVDEKTGRRANPGQDYNCRCVALPVFDIESITLPWENDSK